MTTKKSGAKKASETPKKPAAKKAAPKKTGPSLWDLIEEAWAEAAPELAKARAKPTEDNLEQLDEGAEVMLEALQAKLDALDKDALLAVDRELEEALHRIDREEIQEVTDGSDDGFLYARGFIVAMGRRFFDAVDADPAKAVCDAELEEICYLPFHLYRKKFGEPPPSGISRESGSNEDGWP
jgi:hypothetical protein